LVDLGDSEEKRLSGLRIEKDDLTKELHDTRYSTRVQMHWLTFPIKFLL
jgi:hypothetical protein